jgi:hypothetical protein
MMTEDELRHAIQIAKLFLAIATDLDTRANLRVFIGDCSGRIHRIRQSQAATGPKK